MTAIAQKTALQTPKPSAPETAAVTRKSLAHRWMQRFWDHVEEMEDLDCTSYRGLL